MVKAAFDRFVVWLKAKALPFVGDVAEEWWLDIGDKPRPHFVSMAAGIFIYLTIKLAFTWAF